MTTVFKFRLSSVTFRNDLTKCIQWAIQAMNSRLFTFSIWLSNSGCEPWSISTNSTGIYLLIFELLSSAEILDFLTCAGTRNDPKMLLCGTWWTTVVKHRTFKLGKTLACQRFTRSTLWKHFRWEAGKEVTGSACMFHHPCLVFKFEPDRTAWHWPGSHLHKVQVVSWLCKFRYVERPFKSMCRFYHAPCSQITGSPDLTASHFDVGFRCRHHYTSWMWKPGAYRASTLRKDLYVKEETAECSCILKRFLIFLGETR